MEYKKNVKGERTVAAILDYIFFSIVMALSSLVTLPFFGFEAIMNDPAGGFFNFEATIPYTVANIVIGLVLGFIYYVYVPYAKDGKTFGKMILRVKAIDDLGRNPSLKMHAIRAIMLWEYYISVPLLLVLLAGFFPFMVVLSLSQTLLIIITIIALIMYLAREDSRGLHDLIAGTYIVDERYDADAEVIEAAAKAEDWATIEDSDDDDFMADYDKDDPWER